jgi:lipoprotein NlpI
MDTAALIQSLDKDLAIALPGNISYEELQAQLAAHINQLIKDDFQKLVGYLYRIDVHEQKLKTLLKQHPDEDAGNIIAELIIERQLQKIKTRQHSDNYRNSQRDNEFNEEEKW